MLTIRRKALAMVVYSAALVSLAGADSSLETSRTLVGRWNEARQLISREKSDWREEKVILADTTAALQRELDGLEKQIAEVGDVRTLADKELETTEGRKEQLQETLASVKTRVTGFEAGLRRMAAALPVPLMETVGPLFRQIPENPEETRKSVSSRMLIVVGVLNEINKFNNKVDVAPELRKNADGDELQVKVLYLGLGQAYFVDKSGTFAGVGIPSMNGWKWETRPDLAPPISKAIAVYESAEPAAFVNLPVALK